MCCPRRCVTLARSWSFIYGNNICMSGNEKKINITKYWKNEYIN